MEKKQTVSVRMFGVLHSLRRSRGLDPSVVVPIGTDGKRAVEIAAELNLPLELLGSVYCNHRPVSLQHRVRPGDRVALVPKSVPGPHACLMGLPSPPPPEAAPVQPAPSAAAVGAALEIRPSI